MLPRQRFLYGSIGAFMPVLVTVVSLDLTQVLSDANNFTLPVFLGILIRYIILCFIGGFVAHLHSDENKPFKLFEIGISAPALISSIIAANSVAPSPVNKQVKPVASNISFSSFFISNAHANDIETKPPANVAVNDGFWNDVVQGISGNVYKNAQTVINQESIEAKTDFHLENELQGWAYYGQKIINTPTWNALYFKKKTTNADDLPQIGDIVYSTGLVNMRMGYIEFENGVWKNKKIKRVIRKDEVFKVMEVNAIYQSYIWVRLEPLK